jgi:cytochrome c biogenesis DsbD-like protein
MSEPGTIEIEPLAYREKTTIEIRLTARIPPGTHIESHEPSEPFLIPTVVEVEHLEGASITYPVPVEKDLGLSEVVLSVYEGTVTFTVRGEADPATASVRGALRYQPCVGGACLPPRTAAWEAPVLEGTAPGSLGR